MKRAVSTPRGMHRRDILLVLAVRQKGRCGICQNDLGDLDMCNVDHIIPRSRGGTDRWKNIQAAHIACNSAKADKLLVEWTGRKWITRLPRKQDDD